VGCPIRRSEDPRALAPPLGFSQRATSFIASRCQGIHQMPFSSSSPTPSPKHAAKPRAENRGQTTEDRPRCRNSRPLFCSLVSVTWSLEPSASRQGLRPWRLHTHAQAQPDGTAGPASRSRLASRCQRADDRGQRTRSVVLIPRRKLAVPIAEDRRKDRPISVLCPLSSEPGGPGPTRTADLTLIRRAL
jgi:hypothetical protein